MLSHGVVLQNRYHIVRPIGTGGMATVYLAEDVRLPGRQRVVKEVDPARIPAHEQRQAFEMFQQEARMLAQLDHRNLVPATDFFVEHGKWYLVLDHVAGQTLDQVLEKVQDHRLPIRVALSFFRQLCDVLEYLHTLNPPIVFRDLKPGNIIITPEGVVKLIDFGIARYLKPGRVRDTVKLGTPGYAAPEQYGGAGQSDPRSDIYALGVLLHQMLTGHDPTTSSTPFNLPVPRALNPDISPRVEQAILEATRHDPAARFQSVRSFRQAVLSAGATSRLPQQQPRSNRKAVVVWGILGSVVLFFIMLLGLRALTYARSWTSSADQMPADPDATTVLQASAPIDPPPATIALLYADTPTTMPTLQPTLAPTPTPIPTSTPLPTPTPCGVSIYSGFADIWRSDQARLGCPAQAASTNAWVADQPFERGRMFWREDNDYHYVLYGTGYWERFRDVWVEGMPTYSCGTEQTPPTPLRGFGYVWCTYPRVRDGVGSATAGEWGEYGVLQGFANGSLIVRIASGTYVLYADGGWERR